jgi:FKBP-type peptidyl-prolyl cis-trans isomerase FkpA
MTSKLAMVTLLLAGVAATAACQSQEQKKDETKAGAAAGTKSEDEKTVYAIGLMMGTNVAKFGLSPSEVEALKQGLIDAATGKKPEVELEAYGPKVQAFAQARMQKAAEEEKTKSASFLETAAKEEGAEKTASGLIYKSLTAGTGAQPAASDTVQVHYRGTLTDGKEFDSSHKRGQPAEFPLNGVIPCWTEGVQKMKVGGKAKLVCPSSIAYGDRGQPPTIPGGATLVFEVELISVKGKDAKAQEK